MRGTPQRQATPAPELVDDFESLEEVDDFAGGATVAQIGSVWVRRADGHIAGPYDATTLKRMAGDGAISISDQGSLDRQNWLAITDFPGIAGVLGLRPGPAGGLGGDVFEAPPSAGGADDFDFSFGEESDGDDFDFSFGDPGAREALAEPGLSNLFDGINTNAPAADAPLGGLEDLPQPAQRGAQRRDLPAPKGYSDLPAPRGHGDLPAPRADLPAPKGYSDLPAPRGHSDLPAPRGHSDLPAPRADLPAPRGYADLPAPRADLPAPRGYADLPTPRGYSDLPAPHADLPAPHGYADLLGPAAELPAPKGPLTRGHGDEIVDLPGIGGLPDQFGLGGLPDRPTPAGPSIADHDPMDLAGLPSPEGVADRLVAPARTSQEPLPEPTAQASSPAADAPRSKLPLIAAAVALLAVAGGAGMYFMELGPFAPEPVTRPRAKTPKRVVPKTTASAPPSAQPVSVASGPDPDGLRPTMAPTFAEVAGYRQSIASWEPRKAQLAGDDAATLVELYARGALEFAGNDTWKADAKALLPKLDDGVASQRAKLYAALAAGEVDAVSAAEAWAKDKADPAAQYLLGHALQRKGDLVAARTAFAAAATDTQQLGARRLEALLTLKAGKVDAARSRYDALYQEAAGAPDVTLNLASIAIQARQPKRARKLVEQVLALDAARLAPSDRARALVLKARLALAEERLPDAQKSLEDAVRADPRNIEAIELLSAQYERDGAWDKALAQLELISSSGVNSPELVLKTVEALNALRRRDRAEKALKAGVKAFPKSAALHVALGDTYLRQEKFEDAQAAYEQAREADPLYLPVHMRIARLLERQTKVNAAIRHLEQAVKAYPKGAELYAGLADLKLRIARIGGNAPKPLEQARQNYRKALDLDPSLLDARKNLGVVLLAQNKPKAALTELEALAGRPDFHGMLDVELGQAKQALGDVDGALAHFETALKRDSKNKKVLLAAGIGYFEKSQYDRAADLLRQAYARDLDLSPALYYQGRVAFAQGNTEEAGNFFKRALEAEKSNFEYRYWLGRALESAKTASGDRAAAVEYNLVARAVDRDPRLLKTLCDVYYRRGRMRMYDLNLWNAAKADLNTALKCGADGADTHVALGQLSLNGGDRAKALGHYKAAIKKSPKHAPAHLAIALLYLNDGKSRAAAIRHLKSAAELDPKLADPHYRLCAIYKDGARAKARKHCKTYLELAPEGGFASDAKSLLRSL